MISALVFLGLKLQVQPDPSSQINFESPGLTFFTLEKELEAKTGWDIDVSPEVANEVVCLRLTGQPAGEVFSKIADVTFTKWEFLNDRVRVTLDGERRRAEILAAERAGVEELRKDIGDYIVKSEQTPIPDGLVGEARSDYLTRLRIGLGFLRLVDDVALLRWTQEKRTVFALNPNQWQRPLRGVSQHDMQWLFRQANQIWQEVQKEYENLDLEFDWSRYELQVVWDVSAILPEFQFVDSRGRTLSLGSMGIAPEALEDEPEDGLEEGKSGLGNFSDLRGKISEKLKPSQAGKLYLSTLKAISDRREIPLPDGVAMVKQPLEHEPLKYTVGEGILQLVEGTDRAVIAYLGDQWDRYRGDTLDERYGFTFLNQVEVTEDGVVLVRAYADDLRHPRLSRANLQQFLTKGDEWVTTDEEVADFVVRNHLVTDFGISMSGIQLVFPEWLENIASDNTGYGGLVLWGGISEGQREVLRRRQRILIRDLPSPLRSFIFEMIFDSGSRLVQLDIQRKYDPVTSILGLNYNSEYSFLQGIEQTELGARILEQGFLQFEPEEGWYMGLTLTGAERVRALLGRIFIAETVLQVDERPTTPGSNRARNEFVMGRYTGGRLLVHVGGGMGHNWPLFDAERPDFRRRFTNLNMPEELLKQGREDWLNYQLSPFYRPSQDDELVK